MFSSVLHMWVSHGACAHIQSNIFKSKSKILNIQTKLKAMYLKYLIYALH